MKIYEALKLKAAEEGEGRENNICIKLLNLADFIVKNAREHLKLIISQLPDFDIHDVYHSEKVISNIESLMSQNAINRLSGYELFLLYLSAYLHDCAMALPEWEVRLLKLTEGMEEFTDERVVNSFINDLRPPFKLSEALRAIDDRKNALYGSFNSIKEYIFVCNNEDEFKRDLAERLIQYQEFRNGFTEELKKISKSKNKLKYLEFSDLIRYEYVRQTHAKRVEKYIMNLSRLFCEYLGGMWGNALAKDLADICRAHGESYDFVIALEVEASYFGIETANIQFVSTMLRLGDVLHFSVDRAPKSLFSEKMVESKESIKHWKAKFQGLNYSIGEIDKNGRIKVKYMAYCEEPSAYYFIHDYLNWADDELNNYFKFIHNLNYSINTNKLVDRYTLSIAEKIDRTQIKYDENKFMPVPDARFTLNQKKILELLMGVGLYKNKYLCLREIYQNALDACRCMMSSLSTQNLNTKGLIEFGIGECIVDGINKKYLYCLDNGIGMTKDIIQKFFLNIGNSYYNSREFYRKSVKWNNSFKPTSQFGIGILSCFMIGDRIEITTKALGDNEGVYDAIRFSIDGPHEKFYYMKPDMLDLEKIGSNGTLLKLFLSDGESLNNDYLNNISLIVHGERAEAFMRSREDIYKIWSKNLFKLLVHSIGIVDNRIDVSIRFSNDLIEKLIPWNEPFIINETISDNDFKLLYKDHRYMSDGYSPYEDFLTCKEYIEIIPFSINCDGIEYHSLLCLPKPGIPMIDYRILNFPQTIMNNYRTTLVDGISVDSTNALSQFEHDEKRDIVHNGILNFIGAERPQLSVDRNLITNISDTIQASFSGIVEKVSLKIIDIVRQHNTKYNLSIASYESKMLWDYVLNKFNSISHIFIKHLINVPEADIMLDDLNKFISVTKTASSFISMGNIEMCELNFKELGATSELVLLGKLVCAEVIDITDMNVSIVSTEFQTILFPYKIRMMDADAKPIVIKSDTWRGVYEQYDIVTNIWPIIPDRLFDKLDDRYEIEEISKRSKFVMHYSNSISAIAELDPALINPRFGISRKEHDTFRRKRNMVGRCERISNNFYMQEVNSRGELLKDGKDYFLFAYICPRVLTEEEKVKLEDFKISDPIYYEGVLTGWSIMFLGRTAESVILPGIVDRNEAVERIPNSFWTLNGKIHYYFLDNTPVK